MQSNQQQNIHPDLAANDSCCRIYKAFCTAGLKTTPDVADTAAVAQNLQELKQSIEQCASDSTAILTLEQNLKAHIDSNDVE